MADADENYLSGVIFTNPVKSGQQTKVTFSYDAVNEQQQISISMTSGDVDPSVVDNLPGGKGQSIPRDITFTQDGASDSMASFTMIGTGTEPIRKGVEFSTASLDLDFAKVVKSGWPTEIKFNHPRLDKHTPLNITLLPRGMFSVNPGTLTAKPGTENTFNLTFKRHGDISTCLGIFELNGITRRTRFQVK